MLFVLSGNLLRPILARRQDLRLEAGDLAVV